MHDLRTDSLSGNPDIEMGLREETGSNPDLESFNNEIKEVEKQVDEVSDLLSKIKEKNEEAKSAIKASTLNEIRQQISKDIDQVGKLARDVKKKLEDINQENLDNRQNPGCEKGSAADRTRMNLTNGLTKRFKDLMTEFQTLRQTIDQEYREVIERRVETVTGSKPDEETINNLIETGNSEQIFEKSMLETGQGQIMNTVEEIHERHDGVREIEKKLLELHQIYQDMQVLVDAQGEILENIENQVSDAVEHVQAGTRDLQTAKNINKNSRKWMCIAIIVLLIIIAIVVVSVVQPWKSG